MPIPLTWPEIALRLICALVTGAAIGLNRSAHGRVAGLRTSMLVCLAACIAMLQVNLLLPLAGRSANSFVMNDLMRLPLGILSGMGFIGAGTIIRRGNLVVGVTTAATMWFLTVIGLCFGGGQIALGLTGAAIGIAVLTGFKLIEDRMKQDREGKLSVVVGPAGLDENELRAIILGDGFRISSCAFAAAQIDGHNEFTCELRWSAASAATQVPSFVRRLMKEEGVIRVSWSPNAR